MPPLLCINPGSAFSIKSQIAGISGSVNHVVSCCNNYYSMNAATDSGTQGHSWVPVHPVFTKSDGSLDWLEGHSFPVFYLRLHKVSCTQNPPKKGPQQRAKTR